MIACLFAAVLLLVFAARALAGGALLVGARCWGRRQLCAVRAGGARPRWSRPPLLSRRGRAQPAAASGRAASGWLWSIQTKRNQGVPVADMIGFPSHHTLLVQYFEVRRGSA